MGNRFSSKVRDLGGTMPLALGNLKYDPDEKWQTIARERNKNVLYKWVSDESDMLKLYDTQGEEGVLGFANLHLAPLMFNEGKSTQLIKNTDFEKFKLSSTVEETKGKQSSIKRNSKSTSVEMQSAVKFVEHQAQWRLNKRGLDGETLLHLLLKREVPVCTDIVYMLIREYEGLVQDVSMGEAYFGETLLHLAITADDLDLVAFLIEKGANIEARATGQFFQPDDQLTQPPAKLTSYIGYAYYGEYPLAFAACLGSKDIYDILMRSEADPNKQDSYGNTVLHMTVIHDRADMYIYAIRHYKCAANADIHNGDGFTPLTLAAKMGRKHMFEEMLMLMKQDYWGYSDMTCGLYPLSTLDTINPDGSTNHESALMTIVTGRTPAHLDMLTTEVVRQLLDAKWKAFASGKILERGALTAAHLMAMSTAVYTRNPMHTTYQIDFDHEGWGWDMLRYFCELFVIIMCMIFVIRQQGNEIFSEGLMSYARSLRSAPDKAMFLIANTCILMCIPTRIVTIIYESATDSSYLVDTAYDVEDTLLCIALPGSWFYLLFFARSIFLTGPFVQMIFSMIRGDILRFAVIGTIILMAFAQAFYFLGEPMTQEGSEMYLKDTFTYKSFFETFVTMFRMSMGGYDYEEFSNLHFEYFAKLFFVVYMICMPIMMINMLIAMMGNTYTSIIVQAELAWRAEWARIVMLTEQSVPRHQLRKYQAEYSTEIVREVVDESHGGNFAMNGKKRMSGPNGKQADQITVMSDGSQEEAVAARGLLIITRSKKTRAQQRKDAKNNWKLIVHAIMRVSHELGSVEMATLVCHHRVGKNSVLVDEMDLDLHVEDQLSSLLRRHSLFTPSKPGDAHGKTEMNVNIMGLVALAAQRFHKSASGPSGQGGSNQKSPLAPHGGSSRKISFQKTQLDEGGSKREPDHPLNQPPTSPMVKQKRKSAIPTHVSMSKPRPLSVDALAAGTKSRSRPSKIEPSTSVDSGDAVNSPAGSTQSEQPRPRPLNLDFGKLEPSGSPPKFRDSISGTGAGSFSRTHSSRPLVRRHGGKFVKTVSMAHIIPMTDFPIAPNVPPKPQPGRQIAQNVTVGTFRRKTPDEDTISGEEKK